ncbi:DNA-binding transcriptional LysR family regulator [Crossiella equi]|uniref:DNA-binding transcriptional LysR family regulator n=1 Tax=Crossiella equi TaxID=130796 RepID=A0ABS5AP86_9PSEU|nr:LysR family transcriptional regulator [Crossiella equi]MBP2478212.1 DNA-binding transcriptional LysR family regulator [Crossiella equi]
MSLRQYEYALAIAAEGSVTAAAARLRVAQPSISQQIRGLERELGVPLFARSAKGLVPTVAGRAFLREAEVAVTAARRARAVAQAEAGELTGELLVLTQLGLGGRPLHQALGGLRREHPRLSVTLVEEPGRAETERLVRQAAVDVALVPRLPSPDCDFTLHPLGLAPWVVLGPDPGQDSPHIGYERGSALDEHVSRMLRECCGVHTEPVVRVGTPATAVGLAVQGAGVAVVPAAAVPPGHDHGEWPLREVVSLPVFAAVRTAGGPAEHALLRHLEKEDWATM